MRIHLYEDEYCYQTIHIESIDELKKLILKTIRLSIAFDIEKIAIMMEYP